MCGWLGALLITIVIVAIVESISKTNLPFGWIGNIIAGLIGGYLGQLLLGNTWGPSIFGVLIVQTFIGSLVFILLAKLILNAVGRNRRV
jgi:uncharacterized membrane protein YeaQ/YmgE (transglycosylase-associated protein family)